MTGGRRYSEDLPQGGLEIPCIITFEGVEKDVKKVKRLISAALTPPAAAAESLPPDNKRRKLDSLTDRDLHHDMAEWVRCGCYVLTQQDKNVLLTGQKLTDKNIILLTHHNNPMLNGLQSTLFQSRSEGFESNANAIQIIHSGGNHWIVATTLRCDPGEVRIFDSLYESLDTETFQVVKRLNVQRRKRTNNHHGHSGT